MNEIDLANVLFLESSTALKFPGVKYTARGMVGAVSRDFYITRESYAGHKANAPQLAILIDDKNKNPDVNLKGRKCTGRQTQECGLLVVARSHFPQHAPVCLRASSAQRTFTRFFSDPKVSRKHQYGGYDPCWDDYVEVYFNRPDAQQALHANVTGIPYNWTGCSETINTNWQDSDETMLPIYRKLMKAGLRIWVYSLTVTGNSGDVDLAVPVTFSRYSVEKLKLNTTKPWYTWYRNTGWWIHGNLRCADTCDGPSCWPCGTNVPTRLYLQAHKILPGWKANAILSVKVSIHKPDASHVLQ
ncbi:hypothetical protein SELMODRAFT_423213 [Selaginella moellendorffii]|uniref:Uncharacterized protein n=1 Tax=Selaginella moellendorffii TaxID=88036 RepID=D8SKY2_SELML|nr:hypothetical protein SELMODRAFT_423213 [Selaginella moellendorffii]